MANIQTDPHFIGIVRCRESSDPQKRSNLLINGNTVTVPRKNGKSYLFESDMVVVPGQPSQIILDRIRPDIINHITKQPQVLLFVYGSTGTGKTYTLDGNPNDAGLINHLFDLTYELAETVVTIVCDSINRTGMTGNSQQGGRQSLSDHYQNHRRLRKRNNAKNGKHADSSRDAMRISLSFGRAGRIRRIVIYDLPGKENLMTEDLCSAWIIDNYNSYSGIIESAYNGKKTRPKRIPKESHLNLSRTFLEDLLQPGTLPVGVACIDPSINEQEMARTSTTLAFIEKFKGKQITLVSESIIPPTAVQPQAAIDPVMADVDQLARLVGLIPDQRNRLEARSILARLRASRQSDIAARQEAETSLAAAIPLPATDDPELLPSQSAQEGDETLDMEDPDAGDVLSHTSELEVQVDGDSYEEDEPIDVHSILAGINETRVHLDQGTDSQTIVEQKGSPTVPDDTVQLSKVFVGGAKPLLEESMLYASTPTPGPAPALTPDRSSLAIPSNLGTPVAVYSKTEEALEFLRRFCLAIRPGDMKTVLSVSPYIARHIAAKAELIELTDAQERFIEDTARDAEENAASLERCRTMLQKVLAGQPNVSGDEVE